MTVQCHSFDVFDTCLVRDLAVPSDLFFAVAEDLAAQLEPQLGPDYRHIFFSSRKQAQADARRASKGEDVTLGEIWQVLAEMLPGLDPQAGMAAELAAEAAALAPNRAVLKQVQRLHADGARVVFISDTYLPLDTIRAALVSAGFPATEDNLYVSNEIGVTKSRSGALFRHVLEREGVPAARMAHLGDNWRADVMMARRVGIQAQHIALTKLTRFERALLGAASPRDVLFVSRLVGQMRRFRLDGFATGEEASRDFTAAFSGPFLFIFACWLAERARVGQIARLYFMSRDCYLLWRMAQKMPRVFQGIECRYLYGSRQALYLPGVTRAQPEEMPWLTRPGTRRYLDSLLGTLELDRSHGALSDLSESLGPGGEITSSEQDVELMARLCRPPLSTHIVATAETRRGAALAYLEAEKFFDAGRLAIVDLGWQLTTQRSLNALLRHRSSRTVMRGIYLGVSHQPYSPSETGPVEALFYGAGANWNHQTGARAIEGRKRLLEHILSCAPHGAVQRYTIDGAGRPQPVCGDADPRAQHQQQQLARLAQEFAARLDADCGAGPSEPARLLDVLMREGLSHPEPFWTEALGKIRVGVGKNNLDTVPLHQSYGWRDIADRLTGGKSHSRPWPELSRAAAPSGVRMALVAMRWLVDVPFKELRLRLYKTRLLSWR